MKIILFMLLLWAEPTIALWKCEEVLNYKTGKRWVECNVKVKDRVYTMKGKIEHIEGWTKTIHIKYNKNLIWIEDIEN